MKKRKPILKSENFIDKAKYKLKEALGLFDPVIIYPYRGFGNGKEAFLKGRILEKEDVLHGEKEFKESSLWQNIHKVWKRYESDEIPGVSIRGEFMGREAHTTTDTEGYFTLHFTGLENEKIENGWHKAMLFITQMPFDLTYETEAEGEILVCNQDNEYGIISDVDDTIIQSHATNPFQKLKTLVSKDAQSRVLFEGVKELYDSLIKDYRNPLFFISGSSFNLYDMLTAFCAYNELPKAPFLLRDLGLTADKWLKQDTLEYKIPQIEKILNTYPDLSFICIGDSGQKDPEIYTKILKKYPGRIKAIYIRHVDTDERKIELEKLSKDLEIPLLIMQNSHDALEHAKAKGWV